MIAALLSLLASAVGSSCQSKLIPKEDPRITALGRARAQFGDPSEGHSQDEKHVSYSFERHPTEMYFPFGVSNTRYYINFQEITLRTTKLKDGTTTSEGGEQPYLVKEVKVKDLVKVAWVLKLNRAGGSVAIFPPAYYVQMGTIRYMLERRGLWPDSGKGISKFMNMDMKRTLEFTGYRMRDNVNGMVLWYFVVDQAGNYELPQELDYSGELPKSDVPYPISESEKNFLRSQAPGSKEE